MEVRASLNYLRIAPRKVRQVADLIRGKRVKEAQTVLDFVVRKSANPILKLLKSAVASAQHNFQLDPANLYVSKIWVNEGPKLKRWRPVSRGSAHPIMKRTSHIVLVLDEIKPTKKKMVKKITKEAKEKPAEIIKLEEIKEVVKEKELVERKEKPKFGREEVKPSSRAQVEEKRKGKGVFKRIFRRKAF